MKEFRTSTGSMMVLVVITMGLIVLMAIIGIILNSFLFQNSRSQNKVDALAMSLAGCINTKNRVGQLNEMEDRCRELVYTSRQTYKASSYGDFDYLTSLSNQVLQEARDGQKLVEAERKNQIELIRKEVQEAAARHNAEPKTDTFSVRWLTTYEPRITGVALGSIKNVQSNVRCQGAFRGLAYSDYRSGYFNPKNGLYTANVNARLPEADADLDFKLSALPAAVNNVIAQPRNTTSSVFVSYANIVEKGQPAVSNMEDIPNAVQVTCAANALVGPSQSNEVSVNEISTAITCGASPEMEN